MEPFELLLHQDILEALRKTRGENRKQLSSLFSVLTYQSLFTAGCVL